jgi:hypothetical protein
MVELKRLINSGFGTNCMPPNLFGVTLQKTSIFICGNRTWSFRSRLRSLTYSTFPFRSPMISTRGSQVSSGTVSFETMLLLPVSLVIVSLNYQQIPQVKQGLGITTKGRGITQAFSRFKIHKLLSYLWETMHPTPSS